MGRLREWFNGRMPVFQTGDAGSIPVSRSMEKNKRYWFVRKTYGYGWVPGTWEGWLVLGIYTGGMVSIFNKLDSQSHSGSDTLIAFFVPAVLLTVALLLISVIKGEKPRWQWGRKQNGSSE